MSNAIEVRFQVAGLTEIDRAFRSVEQSAVRLERNNARSYDSDVRAAQRASRDKQREEARADRERERAAQAHERQQIKLTERSVAATAKAADAKIKIEERWAKESLNFAHRVSLEKQKIIDRELANDLRARERHAHALSGIVSRSLGGMARGATNLAGMALSLGGGFGISEIMQKQFAAQRSAALIVNAVTSSGAPPSGANIGNILGRAGAVGVNANMSKDEVARGMLAYAQSAKGGNFQGVMDNAEFMAKLAKVSGTDISAIGEGMGTLQSQNPNLGNNKEAMQAMMMAALAQTHAGHVSLKDAINQVGTLGSTRGFYAGDTSVIQTQLLGLGQLAAMSGGKEEMGTYAKNIALQSAKHKNRATLQSFGVKYNASGEIESTTAGRTAVEDLIAKTFTGTKGNMGAIADIFGPRGLPVFESLKESYKGAGGGKAGGEAVVKAMREVTGATMTSGDLEAQFQQSMSTPGEKFGQTIEKLSNKIEEKLEPHIEELANKFDEWEPKVERLIDAIASAGEFLLDHPFAAIFAVISANVAADVAKAAIGDAIKKSIFGGGGMPGGPGGGGGGGSPGLANGAAATGGWLAAFWGGEHLLESGASAYDTHASGRNAAATAHSYLDKWQSGNAGWIGGAKWNPLVSGANIITGLLSDAGDVKAGDKYAGQDIAQLAAQSEAKSRAMFGTGTGTKHAYDEAGDPKAGLTELQKQTDLLQSINKKLDTGAGANPSAPNRNGPQTDPSRGGTK